MNQKRLELFDNWAKNYDPANDTNEYPFSGYDNVLDTIAQLTNSNQAVKILDLATGTGNLLKRFDFNKHEIWATDFSSEMIVEARKTFPDAQYLQLDLLATELPDELPKDFDYIVSAYVFHEFPLETKIDILKRHAEHLKQDGLFIIGDIAFETIEQREQAKESIGNWDPEESPWAVDEACELLEQSGFAASYKQISSCAGVFAITNLGT